MHTKSSFQPRNLLFYYTYRLDAGTSGCLLLAKSQESATDLIAQFRSKTVQKYYVALSDRRPKKKMGSIVGAMKKGRRGSWLLEPDHGDNPAVTRFISTGTGDGSSTLRAFLVKPETGKTHQIRVALKAMGSPVLGDVRYASKEAAQLHDRLYLHCAAMRIKVLGEPLSVVAAPHQGALFTNESFESQFNEWFPQEMIDNNVWFHDNKLLRSEN